MDIVLPIYDHPVLEAISGASLWFFIVMGVTCLYAFTRTRPGRLKPLILGTAIAVLVAMPFLDVQTHVIIGQDNVTIKHLLETDNVFRNEDIVAVSEVNLKGINELSIRTRNREAYGVTVQGERLSKIGQTLADRLGLKYSPLGELKQWVRE
ncbi:MAG TPA: hypothetical protein VGK74_26885 [Symbiobacteriaceae bacterium]